MTTRQTVSIALFTLLCAASTSGQLLRERRIYRLSLPNKDWSLDVSLADFPLLITEEVRSGGSAYELSASEVPDKKKGLRGLMLRIYMEPAQAGGDVASLRAYSMKQLAKRSGIEKGSLKATEYGQIPLLRFTFDMSTNPIFTSESLPMIMSAPKGLQAFFVKGNTWITVGLSAFSLKKDDEKLFYSLLDSIKIADTSTPRNSFDYFQRGRSLYLQKEYARAIEPLNRALELEQQSSQLEKTQWRNLVMSSADAYGATGNTLKVKDVLEFGISRDPNYYRFHFGLARLFAFIGDLHNTLTSLEKALLYEPSVVKGSIPLEPPISPLSDPTFARFSKSEEFRKAVKGMKRG